MNDVQQTINRRHWDSLTCSFFFRCSSVWSNIKQAINFFPAVAWEISTLTFVDPLLGLHVWLSDYNVHTSRVRFCEKLLFESSSSKWTVVDETGLTSARSRVKENDKIKLDALVELTLALVSSAVLFFSTTRCSLLTMWIIKEIYAKATIYWESKWIEPSRVFAYIRGEEKENSTWALNETSSLAVISCF